MKNVFIKTLSLVAILVASISGYGQDFSFALLSDIHVSLGGKSVDEVRECIKDINSRKELSFAIFAGDITEFGTDEEIKLSKQIFDSLTIPYYIVAGNHDSKWSESGCNTFVKVFGYEGFEFEKEGIKFIGCNSGPNMRMAPALVPRETIVWLDSLSKKIDKQQPVVFVNHYPMDTSVLNYTQVLDILKKMNTQLILNGHWHADRAMVYEGIPAVIGRSSMSNGKRGPGYNIVSVKGSTITFTEVVANPRIKGSPWHTLRMSKGMPAEDSNKYPRPNFDENKNYPNVKELWRRVDNTDIGAGAVKYGKYVLYANTAGIVYACNAENGEVIWSYKTEGKIFSTPDIYNGISLIIGSTDGYIYSLSLKEGKLLWRYKCGKSVLGSPTIYNGKVYIGASDNKFRALNAKTGKLVWEYDKIKGFIEAKPLVDNEQVVFGDWGSTLYSLNPKNGKLQWSWTNNKGRMYSPAAVWPVKAKGLIFIATPERVSYSIDAKRGTTMVKSRGGRESIGLSADNELYFVKTMKDTLFAFSTNIAFKSSQGMPGKEYHYIKWATDCKIGYDIAPTPITSTLKGGKEDKGLVFVPTDKGNIVALNMVDGSIAWRYKLSFALINSMQPLENNRLLVSSMDGIVSLIEY